MKQLFIVSVLISAIPFFAHAESISQQSATATNLGLYGGEVRDMVTDPNSDFVYATTYSPNGFFRSSNNGQTWQGVNASRYDIGEPRGVEMDGSGNIYVLANAGLFTSTNNGATLTQVGEDDIGGSGIDMVYRNGVLAVGLGDGRVAVRRDGSSAFSISSAIRANSYVASIAASANAGLLYAVLDNQSTGVLYVSSNTGSTWTAVDTSDVTNRFSAVAVNPENSEHLILLSYGEDTDPWQSTDGGESWSQIDVYGTPTTVTFDDNGRIYVGISYSDDDGESWDTLDEETPSNRVSRVWPDSENADRLYGGTFGAVAISTNTGASWTDSNTGITAVAVHDVAQSTNKQSVWFATNAGLAHTENFLDSNPTWEFPIQYNFYPQAVWISPDDSESILVGGYNALYRSTNGGDSWTELDEWNADYAVQDIVSDPRNADIVYAVGGVQNVTDAVVGDALKSTDGGATWESLNVTDNAALQTAAVSRNGTLYVGAGAIDINGETATGVYTYNGSQWTHLSNSPNTQVTGIVADPDDANVLYATASTFNSSKQSQGGVYRTDDAGASWTKLSVSDNSGLDTASQYRAITIQGSTNTLYMSGIDTETSKGTIWKSSNRGQTWGVYYTGLQDEDFNTLLFDGLIAGNSRGAYGIKGKVRFVVKKTPHKRKKHSRVITVTLKDFATKKVLKSRKLVLLKKKGNRWKKVKVDRTNRKGKAHFVVSAKKQKRYRVRYVPKGRAAEAYTKTTSKKFKVRRRTVN